MPRCQNCGHTDSFVLLADLAVPLTADPPTMPPAERRESELSLTLQCSACGSTDVRHDDGPQDSRRRS